MSCRDQPLQARASHLERGRHRVYGDRRTRGQPNAREKVRVRSLVRHDSQCFGRLGGRGVPRAAPLVRGQGADRGRVQTLHRCAAAPPANLPQRRDEDHGLVRRSPAGRRSLPAVLVVCSAISRAPRRPLVRPPVPERTLSTLRFIRTRPAELLGVIVLSDGSVENRFIQVEPTPSDRELERLHNMLAEVVEGRTLSVVRDYFARRSSPSQRDELRTLRAGRHDAHRSRRSTPRIAVRQVIIEGQSRLARAPSSTRRRVSAISSSRSRNASNSSSS